MRNNHYLKGLVLTACGVLILSFDALLIRLTHSESFDLLFWRGLLLSVVVALYCRLRPTPLPLLQWDMRFFTSAALFTISTISFVWAINLTAPATVLVIISAQPLLAALLARVLLAERLAAATWLAILISMLGIGWVFQDVLDNSSDLLGTILAAVCALALSAKFVNDRAASDRSMTPALILAGLAIAAISALLGQPLSLQGSQWGWMLLLCLGVTPVAFILITLGPRYLPAAEVGMLMLLETITGPLWVWLVLDNPPSSAALEGGAIVIATLLAHAIYQGTRQRRKALA